MIKSFRFVVLLAILVAGMVFGVSAQDRKILRTAISMTQGGIETIDPGKAETVAQIDAINQMFLGLTSQDVTTGATTLGLADSMTISEDGLTYTFTIRPEVSWVRYNAETDAVEQVMDDAGAPRYVTAQDVADGMRRTLDAATASPYSYVLAPYVTGGVEFNGGDAAAELGITVVDGLTLIITQPSVAGFADAIYGLWMSRPVPTWVIEEFGDEWILPDNIVTNGPFALKSWEIESSMTMIKNPFWAGTEEIPAAQLDEVQLVFLDLAQQLQEYEAGNLDAIDIPSADLARVLADSELSAGYTPGVNPCTDYYGFDNTTAPTDNVHLRRALSFAVDRQALVDLLADGKTVAAFFSYPTLVAAPTSAAYPDLGARYDLELAQAELALALEDLGLSSVAELPVIPLWYNDASFHPTVAQAIEQMWAEGLGVSVQLAPQDPSGYFSRISEDAPNIYRSGWCKDYADANNFLYDVFFSEASQNDTGFVNAEFDALVEQARTETDLAVRVELYAQAEDILVNQQAAIIPLFYRATNQLVRPGVVAGISVTGNQSYYLWDSN
jgi:oligopeptide transport system substrate-binding protein